MESTEPVEVPVVDAANRPLADGPNRVSLPSMFPPDCADVTCWLTPAAASFELPFVSKCMPISDAVTQSRNMAANTTQPWRRSPATFPNRNGSANGTPSSNQISRMLVMGFGFSNGWGELALYGPPPFSPISLI